MLENTLESPLDCIEIQPVNPKGNQSWSEGLMLKLKLQYSVHPMWRTDSLENILMLGKIEGRRRGVDRGWDSWMASLARWTRVSTSSGSWWWTGKPGVLQSMGLKESDMIEWLNWIDYINTLFIYIVYSPQFECKPHDSSRFCVFVDCQNPEKCLWTYKGAIFYP